MSERVQKLLIPQARCNEVLINPVLYVKGIKLVKSVHKSIDVVLQKTLVPKSSYVADTSTSRNR